LNNKIIGKGFLVGLDYICYQTDVVNNTVNGKPVVYRQNIIEEVIPEGAGQIILINCSFIQIKNHNLTKVGVGLYAGFSYNLTIRDNMAIDNDHYGYYLHYSNHIAFINNTARQNYKGVFLYQSTKIQPLIMDMDIIFGIPIVII
jgi:parallel beta-helix repeat protein